MGCTLQCIETRLVCLGHWLFGMTSATMHGVIIDRHVIASVTAIAGTKCPQQSTIVDVMPQHELVSPCYDTADAMTEHRVSAAEQ